MSSEEAKHIYEAILCGFFIVSDLQDIAGLCKYSAHIFILIIGQQCLE